MVIPRIRVCVERCRLVRIPDSRTSPNGPICPAHIGLGWKRLSAAEAFRPIRPTAAWRGATIAASAPVVLVIGLLVDDAIVVVENVERHLDRKSTRLNSSHT